MRQGVAMVKFTETEQYTDTHVYFGNGVLSHSYISVFLDPSYPDMAFNSVEHYIMARKALLFNDRITLTKILSADTSDMATQYGSEVKGVSETAWDSVCINVAARGNYCKFSKPELAQIFCSIYYDHTIVAGNPNDDRWGVGLPWDQSEILDSSNWQGKNYAGLALEKARHQVRNDVVNRRYGWMNNVKLEVGTDGRIVYDSEIKDI